MPTYYPGHPNSSSNSIGQETESTDEISDYLYVSTPLRGVPSMVTFTTTLGKVFKVVHVVSQEDKDIFEAFYLANRNNTFELYYEATQVNHANCMFASPPQSVMIGPGFWTITNNILEV